MLQRLKYLTSVFFAVLLFAPVLAHAADAPKIKPPVTAVIDIQRILKESTAAQTVRTQLEDRRGKLRDEFAKLETELRGAEQELERQRSVLSADAFDEKRQAYERRVADAQRKADSSRRQTRHDHPASGVLPAPKGTAGGRENGLTDEFGQGRRGAVAGQDFGQ